jgi:hypothetical protein
MPIHGAAMILQSVRVHWRAVPAIIQCVAVTHLLWAGVLLLEVMLGQEVWPITAMWSLTRLCPPPVLRAALLATAAFAVLGMSRAGRYSFLWALAPQLVLVLGCWDVVTSAGHGHYPDGYAAHPLFIFRDQMLWLILTYYHWRAVVR